MITAVAQLLRSQGKLADAEPLVREVLAACSATLGEQHPNTLAATHRLASLLHDRGDFDAAETLMVPLMAECRQTLGEQHLTTADVMSSLAWLYIKRGRFVKAEMLFLEELAVYGQTVGPEHDQLRAKCLYAVAYGIIRIYITTWTYSSVFIVVTGIASGLTMLILVLDIVHLRRRESGKLKFYLQGKHGMVKS